MSSRLLLAIVFVTGCGEGWHGAHAVDDRPHRSAAGSDPFPAAAMAGQRPIVVWGTILQDGFRATPGTWARWHDGTSWSTFASLGARTQRPTLVASTNGSALALVADGVTHFDGVSWSAPAAVDLGDAPKLAMDGAGNALAVGSNGDELVVTTFEPSAGWGTPLSLAEGASSHLVAMSEGGSAIVVWSDGTAIRARRRSPLGIWSTNRTVDTGCIPVGVRMFGVDQVVVLGDCGPSLRLSRSGPFGGFFAAGETPSGPFTQLAVNSNGGALVGTTNSGTLSVIHAPAGMPLSAPLVVTTSLIPPSAGATFGISLDSEEKGHVVFSEYEGVNRLKGRELDGNARTLTSVFIVDAGSGSAYYPSLAGADDGKAIVAWNQSGSNPEEIWANLYY
jgi:hypothetical protein